MLKLLDIQQTDSRLLQLRHQRANLPEAKEILSLRATRKELDDRARDERIRRDDLIEAQKKADRDVEAVKLRRKRDQDRMDSGAVGSAKDLEHMQHELAALDRRIGVLEDEELEVMEQLESAEKAVAELEGQVADLDEKIAAVAKTGSAKAAELDEQLRAVEAERGPAVADMPADLMALYERLRDSKGGVGAAELRARQCGGCMLTLDPAELSRIRGLAEDEVVRCEECGRILVRTPESGL